MAMLNNQRVIIIDWVGSREDLQENPIFHGKKHAFRLRFSGQGFPLNQFNEFYFTIHISLHTAVPTDL